MKCPTCGRATGKASLTKRQAELFGFIEKYMAENDAVSPSFAEMADAIGLKSKSGVHRLITGLEDRGWIKRANKRSRCITICD